MPGQKITPHNYDQIRDFALRHTKPRTMKEYGISRTTYRYIIAFPTYDEYHNNQITQSAKWYAKRRKQKEEGPFGDAPKPPVVLPPAQPISENKNGPVITRPYQPIGPQTMDDYRRENEELRKRWHLALDDKQSLREQLNSALNENQNLQSQLESLQEKEEKPEVDVSKLTADELNTLNTQQALKNFKEDCELIRKVDAPTTIEIEVGEVKITITGGNLEQHSRIKER